MGTSLYERYRQERGGDEPGFRKWYAGWARKAGIDPDPDNPLHKYDYRAAYRAGATPQIDSGDGLYHWPSEFKADDHPNRFVKGVDTKALQGDGSPLYEEYRRTAPAGDPPLTPKEKLRASLASAYQGLTFGLGNKLTALTRKALYGEDYGTALADERKQLTRFRSEHPVGSMVAEVAGGVPATLALPASGPATLARSLKTGATYGGMYGAGEGDNPDAMELALRTGAGAFAGAAGAGVVHGVAKAPGAVMDYTGVRPSERSAGWASRLARSVGVQSVEERAPQIILNRLSRAKLTPADVTAKAQDATDLGKPATLIDLGGKPMARLARGAQGVPGKGSEDIAGMLENRRRGAPVRVASDVESGLGQKRQDTYALGQQMAERQRGKSKPLYDEAMKSEPLSVDAGIPGKETRLSEVLQRPSAQKAIGYESQLAKEEGRAPFPSLSVGPDAELMAGMPPEAQKRFAELAKAQGVEINPTVTMEQLHNLKLRLDEMLGYAKSRGSLPDGTPATSKMLRAIQDTKNDILAVMDSHSGKYKEARRVWGGEAELQDALELGQDFLNAKRPLGEVKQEIAALSDAGRENLRVGVVASVRDKIDAAPDGADVVRRIFGNEAQRQRLRLAFPDDQSFNQFRRQMEMESQMARNENFVQGNSQTAEKLADQADIMGHPAPSMFTPRGVANWALQTKVAEQLRARAEQRVDALAPYLTAGGPTTPGSVVGSSQARERMLRRLEEALTRQAQRNRRAGTARAIAGQLSSRSVNP